MDPHNSFFVSVNPYFNPLRKPIESVKMNMLQSLIFRLLDRLFRNAHV